MKQDFTASEYRAQPENKFTEIESTCRLEAEKYFQKHEDKHEMLSKTIEAGDCTIEFSANRTGILHSSVPHWTLFDLCIENITATVPDPPKKTKVVEVEDEIDEPEVEPIAKPKGKK